MNACNGSPNKGLLGPPPLVKQIGMYWDLLNEAYLYSVVCYFS